MSGKELEAFRGAQPRPSSGSLLRPTLPRNVELEPQGPVTESREGLRTPSPFPQKLCPSGRPFQELDEGQSLFKNLKKEKKKVKVVFFPSRRQKSM